MFRKKEKKEKKMESHNIIYATLTLADDAPAERALGLDNVAGRQGAQPRRDRAVCHEPHGDGERAERDALDVGLRIAVDRAIVVRATRCHREHNPGAALLPRSRQSPEHARPEVRRVGPRLQIVDISRARLGAEPQVAARREMENRHDCLGLGLGLGICGAAATAVVEQRARAAQGIAPFLVIAVAILATIAAAERVRRRKGEQKHARCAL
jgi:hypothetical protein